MGGDPSGTTIVHVALQGCLRAGAVEYGITADTGGHIRYLLELVEALRHEPAIARQIVVTRAFEDPTLGPEYLRPLEQLTEGVELWRIPGRRPQYLPKEALWQEVDVLAARLTERLEGLGGSRVVLHAHYADAGSVAAIIKRKLGLPFLFTAHSLGAVKRGCIAPSPTAKAARPGGDGEDLDRRIGIENDVIAQADLAIVSSNDEATRQFGLYPAAAHLRTRVIAPGCELENFRRKPAAAVSRGFDRMMHRFLCQPEKRCVFALARPVRKKNLAALVRCFGSSGLRERANLLLIGGSRDRLAQLEPESEMVWRELLELIDQFDLYGSVAYPKQHCVGDVPAMFRWVAERRGVFVNPAFHEPFGLTLLEAAAAGVPVVTTRHGGPSDIVGHCQNGLLIDPGSDHDIAASIEKLLEDADLYDRCRTNGIRSSSEYTWERHAREYVRSVAALAKRVDRRPLRRGKRADGAQLQAGTLVTDMDGTLLGSQVGLSGLKGLLSERPDFGFVVATGRHCADALEQLHAWRAPLPHLLISEVGAAIHRRDRRGTYERIAGWAWDWDRDRISSIAATVPGLRPQPSACQSAFKLSYTLESGDLVEARGILDERLRAAGCGVKVIASHGRLVDLLPVGAGKGRASRFLARRGLIGPGPIIAAGDSGNDYELLRGADFGIVVANHCGELQALAAADHVYWSAAPYACGVLEGLEHFGVLARRGSKSDAA